MFRFHGSIFLIFGTFIFSSSISGVRHFVKAECFQLLYI